MQPRNWPSSVANVYARYETKNFNHDYIILRMCFRYIHFVKGYFKPVLTKEAEKVISSYYQLQRRSATHNAGFT